MKTIFLKWAAIMIAASFAFVSCGSDDSSSGDGFAAYESADLEGSWYASNPDYDPMDPEEPKDLRITIVGSDYVFSGGEKGVGWSEAFEGKVKSNGKYIVLELTGYKFSDPSPSDPKIGERWYIVLNEDKDELCFTGDEPNAVFTDQALIFTK